MDRRNFLRSMLGVAAATALPSEVWPFKKIFLPLVPRIIVPDALNLATIEAIELSYFAKSIPDLVYRDSSLYQLLKKGRPVTITAHPFRMPICIEEYLGELA